MLYLRRIYCAILSHLCVSLVCFALVVLRTWGLAYVRLKLSATGYIPGPFHIDVLVQSPSFNLCLNDFLLKRGFFRLGVL